MRQSWGNNGPGGLPQPPMVMIVAWFLFLATLAYLGGCFK